MQASLFFTLPTSICFKHCDSVSRPVGFPKFDYISACIQNGLQCHTTIMQHGFTITAGQTVLKPATFLLEVLCEHAVIIMRTIIYRVPFKNLIIKDAEKLRTSKIMSYTCMCLAEQSFTTWCKWD